jgi:hypothetical protein
VIFANRTWWHQSPASIVGLIRPPGHVGGTRGRPHSLCVGAPLLGWGTAYLGNIFSPVYVREAVACGSFVVTGHQRLNGIDTIRLVQAGFAKSNPYAITLWVDAATYLLVRTMMMTNNVGGRPLAVKIVTSYTWRPVTKARLRALRIAPVPAGFKQVSSHG